MYERTINTTKTSNSHKFITTFLIIIFAFIIYIGYVQFVKKSYPPYKMFDKEIALVAKRYSIDSRLIKALIWQESKFNPNAQGAKNEIGLMQIRMIVVEDWAKVKGYHIPPRGTIFSPSLNIEIGTWLLAQHLKSEPCVSYKNGIAIALAQYNAGRRRAFSWKDWPPKDKLATQKQIIDGIGIKSTQNYVRSILEKYKSDSF